MKLYTTAVLLVLAAGLCLAQTEKPQLPPGDSPTPTVFDRIKDAGDTDSHDGADYVVVVDSTVNRINDKGVTYTDKYLLYKLLSEQGCVDHAVLNERYEPLSSWVEIRQVRIIRGDSAIDVPMDGVLDLPAPQSAIYWGDRAEMLQLPRLHVGDGIEITLFRKGYSYALLEGEGEPDDEKYIPPMPGQYFDIVLFEARVPMLLKKYILKLPAEKRMHSKIYNGPMYSATSYTKDTTIYSWWVEDVKAWKPERYRPDASDFLSKVVIATVESWEAKSRWFFEVNEPQFAYTDAIKAKVDEILADAGVSNGSDEEKAFELVHWVAENIRYSGQTMGEGEGYTLHSGEMIFEQRSGVCKDIAGMLITMMRAAGLDSYGAMTMAGSRIEEVPADQFNHCVVALRKDDGTFEMYDPTWVPDNMDIWSKFETEQHYLIGTPEGEPRGQIAYSPPEESPLHVTHTGSISQDGTLEGTFELRALGAMDSRLRGLGTWFAQADIRPYLEQMLAQISNRVQLLQYEHGDLSDFSEGMWWTIDYMVPEYAMLVDSGYEFKSPLMQFTAKSRILFRAATVDWPEKRRDDVFFYNTQLLEGKETLTLPGGFEVSDPGQSEKLDETYASFEGTAEMDGRKLAITQTAAMKRRQVPPDGYDGFRNVMKEAKEYANTVFRAEKGGSK